MPRDKKEDKDNDWAENEKGSKDEDKNEVENKEGGGRGRRGVGRGQRRYGVSVILTRPNHAVNPIAVQHPQLSTLCVSPGI